MKFTCGLVEKNPPANVETRVQPVGQEDPLEKEMATHSSTLTWEIFYGQRILEGYSPWGQKTYQLTTQHNLKKNNNNNPT